MIVTPYDVAAFLGKPEDAATVALAEQHLPIVTQMVRAYVRDKGFTDDEPGDDIAVVILTSTARQVDNPTGLREHSTGIDDATFTARYGIFNGWTLPELAVLHRYRKRAL